VEAISLISYKHKFWIISESEKSILLPHGNGR
jgi:hypothetical protein